MSMVCNQTFTKIQDCYKITNNRFYRENGENYMLYIMRHGKTDWNELHKLQGRTDIPLNDEGREMAREAREKYKDINFDICYCSPLVRARETAKIFLEGRNIDIIPDDRLKEMSFGIYEGTANCIRDLNCPVRVLFKDPANYKGVEGGESLEQLYARTGDFLEKVVKPQLTEGRDILIVGHGAMNSSILCQVKNIPVEKFWDAGIENCRLMKL